MLTTRPKINKCNNTIQYNNTLFRDFGGFYLLTIVSGQSYRQLKASKSCDHDDQDDVEIAQRILELSHVRRLSHLSEDNLVKNVSDK